MTMASTSDPSDVDVLADGSTPATGGLEMKDRQLPVVVLTLIAAGLGAATMVAGLALVGLTPLGFMLNDTRNSALAGLVGVAQLVVGVASLALAFGFWLQRSWAWGLGVAVFGLSIGVDLLGVLSGVSSLASVVFLIAISVLVLWYLYQPKTKTAFGR
jgi:hypothetical protein